MPRPFRVFISYAHDDSKLLRELEQHLDILKQNNTISTWSDTDIVLGDEWEKQIDAELKRAQIILFLVSASFLSSPFCKSVEMKTAIELHEANKVRVIPILLRPVYWETAPFAKLQVIPLSSNNKPTPVTSWEQPDEAFRVVTWQIDRLAQELERLENPTNHGQSDRGDVNFIEPDHVKPSDIRVVSSPSREGNQAIILFKLGEADYTLEYTRRDNFFSNQIIFLKHNQKELIRMPVPFATFKPINKQENFTIDGANGLLTFKMMAVTGIMNVKVEIEGVEVFHN